MRRPGGAAGCGASDASSRVRHAPALTSIVRTEGASRQRRWIVVAVYARSGSSVGGSHDATGETLALTMSDSPCSSATPIDAPEIEPASSMIHATARGWPWR